MCYTPTMQHDRQSSNKRSVDMLEAQDSFTQRPFEDSFEFSDLPCLPLKTKPFKVSLALTVVWTVLSRLGMLRCLNCWGQGKIAWVDSACADCPGFLVPGAASAPASSFV